MLSFSPFIINSFIPTISIYNVDDCRGHFQQPLVHHRKPNHSLTEDKQAAYLQVDLPGVAKENVNLHLEGNNMVLTAKRFTQNVVPNKQSSEKNEEMPTKPDHVPKPSVVYELKLRIGNRYDIERIEACMERDGLLNLTIPTSNARTPRNIEIH